LRFRPDLRFLLRLFISDEKRMAGDPHGLHVYTAKLCGANL
jgi:hypothetical protein